jgi:hypothetical protein
MNMYWVYDLPNWLFGLLIIATTEAIGLGGLYATRKFVRQLHRGDDSHNGIVGWYLSAICVFYGITRTSIAECRCGFAGMVVDHCGNGSFSQHFRDLVLLSSQPSRSLLDDNDVFGAPRVIDLSIGRP